MRRFGNVVVGDRIEVAGFTIVAVAVTFTVTGFWVAHHIHGLGELHADPVVLLPGGAFGYAAMSMLVGLGCAGLIAACRMLWPIVWSGNVLAVLLMLMGTAVLVCCQGIIIVLLALADFVPGVSWN